MKVLVIGPETQNTFDLVSAAKEQGLSADHLSIREICLDTHNTEDSSFFSYDAYIFRGYNRSFRFAMSLARQLHARGKAVIDNGLIRGEIYTKLEQAILFASHGVSHPRTFYCATIDQWSLQLDDVLYPLVIKPVDAQKGQGVAVVQNKKETLDVVLDDPSGYILQEFLQHDFDIRVVIVGQEIVGAMSRRSQNDDDFRNNVSLGAVTELYELSADEAELALRAHRAVGYDVSGVDLITHCGRSTVIEVNARPEWQAFKSTTGIDVGSRIVEYVSRRLVNGN